MFIAAFFLLAAASSFAQTVRSQPDNIRLTEEPRRVYSPFETNGWNHPATMLHWGDDPNSQKWVRGCGATAGQKLYASISGEVVISGWYDDIGNAVAIYDEQSRAAFVYTHLAERQVNQGNLAFAGITGIGAVGNTGNVSDPTCGQDSGAHAYLALHNNIDNPYDFPYVQRPVAFGYDAPVVLRQGDMGDPSVFQIIQIGNGTFKRLVAPFVAETHGWTFTSDPSIQFTASVAQAYLNQLGQLDNFPPRNGVSYRGVGDPTVFVEEDGVRKIIPNSGIADCQHLDYQNARLITSGPGPTTFLPYQFAPVIGICVSNTYQAIKDMRQRAAYDGRFKSLPLVATYAATNMFADPDWEWRQMVFEMWDGQLIPVNHITYKHGEERYTEFFDPDTGQNTGWVPAW